MDKPVSGTEKSDDFDFKPSCLSTLALQGKIKDSFL